MEKDNVDNADNVKAACDYEAIEVSCDSPLNPIYVQDTN